jgi:hypothetical protein
MGNVNQTWAKGRAYDREDATQSEHNNNMSQYNNNIDARVQAALDRPISPRGYKVEDSKMKDLIGSWTVYDSCTPKFNN